MKVSDTSRQGKLAMLTVGLCGSSAVRLMFTI